MSAQRASMAAVGSRRVIKFGGMPSAIKPRTRLPVPQPGPTKEYGDRAVSFRCLLSLFLGVAGIRPGVTTGWRSRHWMCRREGAADQEFRNRKVDAPRPDHQDVTGKP